MFSFAVTRIVTSLIEFILLYGFAYYYFDIVIQGSLAALALMYIVGITAFTGISVLAASRAENTRTGNGVINAVTIPMTILSGIFFSYHSFPAEAVFIIQLMPLTTLSDTIRSIFNEGAGFLDVMQPAVILTLEGIVSFFLGIKLFKWQ